MVYQILLIQAPFYFIFFVQFPSWAGLSLACLTSAYTLLTVGNWTKEPDPGLHEVVPHWGVNAAIDSFVNSHDVVDDELDDDEEEVYEEGDDDEVEDGELFHNLVLC